MGDLYDLVKLPKSAHEATGHTPPKILLFDIESTDLKADFGWMMGFGWQWYGEDKVNTIGIHQTKPFKRGLLDDDSELIKLCHTLLSQADSVVFHYGDRFDMKFFKTRLLDIGLYFPKVHTVDTWKVAKRHLLLQRNSMANIAEFVGGEQKTHVGKMIWRKARLGHIQSIKKIMAYCAQDIRTLHNVYTKLLPYCNVINHNLFLKEEGCPTCGSKDLMANGNLYTMSGKKQRFYCRSCNSFFTDRRTFSADKRKPQ